MYRLQGFAKYNAEFAFAESILLRGRSESGMLKFCNFRKMEIADFHGGNNHFEGLFTCRADCGAEKFDVAEHLDQRLVKAKVADRRDDAAIFHEEESVAGHAGHDLFVGIDFA